ncbi:hypothetical protein [Xanthomonas arboricola]|uniref:hypothetical protein n=1 Tax=Xanthomonas arboricola TaxID=56448 RepID=UPI00185153BD|nr:hypothetical protein [Xanthomonas arboricola]MBB6572100.1 hypothetical protein [Xanthomonas arboricola]
MLSLRRTIEELEKKLSSVADGAPEGAGFLAQGQGKVSLGYTFAASEDRWTHTAQPIVLMQYLLGMRFFHR